MGRSQPAQVLQLVVKRAGEIVTREEIQQPIWTEDIVINFEVGLNRCIGQIRTVLLDDADVPRYIETIPRVGYRFIALVTVATSVPEAPPSSPEVLASAPKPPWQMWASAACCLAIAGIAGLFSDALRESENRERSRCLSPYYRAWVFGIAHLLAGWYAGCLRLEWGGAK